MNLPPVYELLQAYCKNLMVCFASPSSLSRMVGSRIASLLRISGFSGCPVSNDSPLTWLCNSLGERIMSDHIDGVLYSMPCQLAMITILS